MAREISSSHDLYSDSADAVVDWCMACGRVVVLHLASCYTTAVNQCNCTACNNRVVVWIILSLVLICVIGIIHTSPIALFGIMVTVNCLELYPWRVHEWF